MLKLIRLSENKNFGAKEAENLKSTKEIWEVMAKDMHRGCLLLCITPPYCIIPTVTFTM
jgi:hypothetical protein